MSHKANSTISREVRARASLERRSLTEDEKAKGYIGALRGEIPFNSDSCTLSKRGRAKQFVEQIAPDAFARSLKEDRDIMANAGHTDDPLAALGRIGENLTVTTDEKTLRWEALVPDTRACADMLVLVDAKIICGTSFEFEVRGVAGEKWEVRDANLDQRTILDARLIAFNPVTWPAYLDSSMTVEMRRRENRDSYFSTDAGYRYNVTSDVAFAIESLGSEVCELCDSLEYLRDNPSGALADYANAEVADSAADVAMLTAWLAANGATVPPDLILRSTEKLAEARTKLPPNNPEYDRERRVRILKLAPANNQ